MVEPKLHVTEKISDSLLVDLDRRDAVLWLRVLPTDPAVREVLTSFLGLPWRMVFLESTDPKLIKALEDLTDAADPLARKRGFIQIIDSDPSRIELPPRCLPIYLLDARGGSAQDDFQSRLRRMTMLEQLRRSGARQILIVSGDDAPLPPEIEDLWSSGFRSFLNFATDSPVARVLLEAWASAVREPARVSLLRLSPGQVAANILRRYEETYPEERIVIRLRDRAGQLRKLDITEIDEPERPLLNQYSLIEERHLSTLTPEQLSDEEFVSFFQNPESSWRPYAAGLPWERDHRAKRQFGNVMKKLDDSGPEENCIAYVAAEPGAGGTTFVRMLAWDCAREGYPVLVAKQFPFVPDALSIANFLNRVRSEYDGLEKAEFAEESAGRGPNAVAERSTGARYYEVPWIIVFDQVHWQYRDGELRRFRNELEKQRRPVRLLVVSGPIREMSYFDTSVFTQIGELNHVLDRAETLQLGNHLNRFLRLYGKAREERQWDRFYQDHTVRYLDGMATFWVTLSFWLQGQYDISETIQEWIYSSFKERVDEGLMQNAILEIAAVSSERLPLPEELLPISRGEWPVSALLEDRRSNLGALGLVRIAPGGERYWALVHDILGRLLINALSLLSG